MQHKTYRTISLSIMIISLLWSCNTKHSNKEHANKNIPPKFVTKTPVFKKEGELIILSSVLKDTIAKLDIEISNEDDEMKHGLQFYEELKPNCGMLFAFKKEKRTHFWMKNTQIALDFIFINSDNEISDISPNNKPYSLQTITTVEYVKYVLCVNAFYSEKHHLNIGDKMEYISYKDKQK